MNRSLVWKGFKKRPLLLYMKIGVRGRRIGMHILTPVGESPPLRGEGGVPPSKGELRGCYKFRKRFEEIKEMPSKGQTKA